jgi:alkaline phosphatase
MIALEEGSKSFAQFTNDLWTLKQSDETNPTLSQMTEKAIDLLDDGENGFFLMVEGAHIDKHSHNNESENMTEAMAEFDKSIKIALEFAKKDDVLIVQGDFASTFMIVDFALKNELIPICATTKRIAKESRQGEVVKREYIFEHVCFRKYEYYKN